MSDQKSHQETHFFDVDLACEIGIEEACVVERLKIWIKWNHSQRRNIKYGRVWTYNTLDALLIEFPYLRNRQKVQRLMEKLVALGVLVKGQHATRRNDRTTWYAFSDVYAKRLNLGISHSWDIPDDPTPQKREMDLSDLGNGDPKSGTCIDIENHKEPKKDAREPGAVEALAAAEQFADSVEVRGSAFKGACEPLVQRWLKPHKAWATFSFSLPPTLSTMPDTVPVGLFLDWLVASNASTPLAELDQLLRIARQARVSPTAVLLFSIKQPLGAGKSRRLSWPAPASPTQSTEPKASKASLRAAKSAPGREHVG